MPHTLLELRVPPESEGPIVAKQLFSALHNLSHPVSFEIASMNQRIRRWSENTFQSPRPPQKTEATQENSPKHQEKAAELKALSPQ